MFTVMPCVHAIVSLVHSCCAGLTVAEHFRDAEGQDVLLFIDNIFRFTQVKSNWFRPQHLPGLKGCRMSAVACLALSHADKVVDSLLCDLSKLCTLSKQAAHHLMHGSNIMSYVPAGQLRGVCPFGTYSLCCGLPANSGY